MPDKIVTPTPRTRAFKGPALSLVGGLLVAFSLPPWGFWPLAIIGVMLFETALGVRSTRRQRLLDGWLFGAAWMYVGMWWMVQLTLPGYIAAGAIFAGGHAVAALVAPSGRWRVIGRPAAHTLVEVVRFSFPFGGVPLASLGISQAGGPLLGIARLGGVILITWVVFQLGFALAGPAPAVPRLVRRRRPSAKGAPHGVFALAAVVIVIVIAAIAPQGSRTGRTITIAAVQGGGEQGTRAEDVPSRVVTERHLEATQSIDPDPNLDLVLWPENVIDINDEPFEGSAVNEAVAAEAARLGVPFAVGVTEDADQTGRGEPGRITNAQVVVTPDGRVTSRYDKVRRVPFGEYVPMRGLLEALGAPVDQVRTNAVAGTEPAVIELPDGTKLGVVISWEVFFGGRAREGVKHGASVIVNPTNGASYTGTVVQTQQVASSRLRAVETGRWVVQAAPTGFSAFVSPSGEVHQRTGVSERAVITREIELRDGRTWYVRIGDGPWIVAVLVVFLVAVWFGGGRAALARRRDARREAPTSSD
ncbi:MAG TPA: apolipoprotein N-acyltransferase [Ilumatobacteraceae bacterium]|nr:apolipoprotein N-acyltransferase [Ilumatobacteraceae bacterium]